MRFYLFLAVIASLLAVLAGGTDPFASEVIACRWLSWDEALNASNLRIVAAIIAGPFAVLAVLHLVVFIREMSAPISPSVTLLLSVLMIIGSWPINDWCDPSPERFAFPGFLVHPWAGQFVGAILVGLTWVPIMLVVTSLHLTLLRISSGPVAPASPSLSGEQRK